VGGCRNTIALKEGFGVRFAPLQFGSVADGTKNAFAAGAKVIHNAVSERLFGADDGQIDPFTLDQCQESIAVIGLQGNKGGKPADPRIPRGTEEPPHPEAFAQFPYDGMFAPA
jgi:hypothetical protein